MAEGPAEAGDLEGGRSRTANNFFSERSVLVTGGSGFIGTHLVQRLLRTGANVSIVDLVPPSPATEAGTANRLNFDVVDLRRWPEVEAYFSDRQFDYVFHLAAKTIVEDAYDDPRDAVETNVMGTVNVLEALRSGRVPRLIVVASSDKAYGRTNGTSQESSPLNASHPYDTSKASADLVARAYCASYGLPVAVTRFANVYGEGDLHLGRIVPGICHAVLTGTRLKIRSDGSYVRDYLYVGDAVDGCLSLAARREQVEGEAFNFTSRDNWSVLQLVGLAEQALGCRIPYEIENVARNEIPYQHLDDAKIRRLGWTNTHSFAETLPQILEWYRAYVPVTSLAC